MYSHSTINILRHTQTEKHIHICARISKHTHTRTRTRSYPDTDTQSNVKCKQKFHDSPQLLLQPAVPLCHASISTTPPYVPTLLFTCMLCINTNFMLFTQTLHPHLPHISLASTLCSPAPHSISLLMHTSVCVCASCKLCHLHNLFWKRERNGR